MDHWTAKNFMKCWVGRTYQKYGFWGHWGDLSTGNCYTSELTANRQRSFTGRGRTGSSPPGSCPRHMGGSCRAPGLLLAAGRSTCAARAGQAEHSGTRREPPFPPVSLQCPVLTKLNMGLLAKAETYRTQLPYDRADNEGRFGAARQ